jgi:hypothetical protein
MLGKSRSLGSVSSGHHLSPLFFFLIFLYFLSHRTERRDILHVHWSNLMPCPQLPDGLRVDAFNVPETQQRAFPNGY